ncbi:hypothetical protein GCM10010329_18320 [Streptomyces spiroverticillatus]|uniref:Uncharacterized protein n=1 Tax=Streptomyces finlayi TaxID=67296 RepID=A0A918WTZ6_9ACTN|nr:hypothetical protein GCM10010329_18320 [Streptomyces spiroverticillatus]GHC82510.1 hypothetical protein GCM10010334_10800 [Streptomyces finlayi]
MGFARPAPEPLPRQLGQRVALALGERQLRLAPPDPGQRPEAPALVAAAAVKLTADAAADQVMAGLLVGSLAPAEAGGGHGVGGGVNGCGVGGGVDARGTYATYAERPESRVAGGEYTYPCHEHIPGRNMR